MKNSLKRTIITLCLTCILLLFAGCDESSDKNLNKDIENKNQVENAEINYVDDKNINEFINAFNSEAETDITDLANMSAKQKYSGMWGDYYLVIEYSDTYGLVATFDATTEAPDMEGLKEAVDVSLSILATSKEKADVTNVWEQFMADGYIKDGTAGNIEYTFVPTVALTNGNSLGHVKIISHKNE